jgi:hypothetical protein
MKSINKEKILKKYKELEYNNDHNEATLLLIKYFGTDDERWVINKIRYKQERRGFILPEEISVRSAINKKYYKLLYQNKNII